MKIVFDATALYGKMGGIQNALFHTFAALRELDKDNSYLVYVPADAPENLVSSANWRYQRLPFRGADKLRRIVWQQLELPILLRRERADLLHCWNYVAPILAPIPTVLTVQDLIALNRPRFAARANRLHFRALMPQSLKRAARVLVTTPRGRAEVLARAPGARVRVIPLGVEAAFFDEVSAAHIERVRRKYELPPRFLFFLGNFEPKKNLPNLLRALRMLPGAPPLVVAGGLAPWPAVQRRLGNVQQLGFVPRGDVPALLRSCEIFCFPSLCEGFGLPILEALAVGAPVVASSAVPLPNLQSVALCPPPRFPRAIAEAVGKLLDDAELRAQMSAAGREYARPFTWENAARATLGVYREFEGLSG